MKKIYSITILITCLALLDLREGFAQSLSRIGNSNFPINDNTSAAPVSAINSGWQINGIGKIITIVPHPSVATTLFACTGSGGIFITTNSGTSWSPVSGSFLPGVQLGCIAIDPGNPNTMYAGTGEPSYAQTYGWGGYGTFKSTDAGANWTQMNTGMGNKVVLDLLINPANTQELVAATNDGIYKSINGGTSWSVAMSSAGSWIQQVLRQSAGMILVAVGGKRFYRSTDFGNTWSTTDLDPAFSSTFANGRVAVAASNSNIVYAGWVNNTFSNANNISLYYSTDGGVSFTKKYAFTDPVKLISYDGVSSTGYGWANFILTISKTDPNTIYSGGHLIFKSTNNGVNWTLKTPNWYCCIHTDIRQLIYDPNNISRFLASTDGGVFASTDDAVSWAQVSNGLSCNQYMSMGQSNLDPNFVVGGLQDNGIIYNNEDGNYHTYTGGDLYDHMTCDYTNSYNVYTRNSGGKVFNPYDRSAVANLNLPGDITSGAANRQSFFLSPIDPTIAFGWGTNVWRSSNVNSYDLSTGTSSVSWTQISSFAVSILDVKISPASNNVVYALGNNATVYKSVNATSVSPGFTPIALPAGASTSIEGSLTVSALNPNVLYASANNTVYRSCNAGATWTNYTATGLPAINFDKLFVDPYSSIEGVYLVTTLGIYYRDLTMNTWMTVNPQVPTQQQNSGASYGGLINGASLYKGSGSSNSHVSFATWGSGIWKAGFYSQLNNPLPTGWSNTDIGSPSLAGSGFYDNTKLTFNVKGAGSGINNSISDQFNFTKATVSGNSGDIIAKIYSVAETDPVSGLSKTGVMLRASANANAPYAMIALTGHAGAVFQYRVNAGDVATVITTSPAPTDAYPYWVKLNKNSSNVITAFISPDGNTWTQVGQATVLLGTSFLAGIANTSNNTAVLNNAAVNNVTLVSFVIPIQNIVLNAVLKEKNKVALSWSFDTNDRNDLANIERSIDGVNFISIFQKTYINSNSSQQSFHDALVDETAFKGKNYYRLKITGQDGQNKFSNIQQVSIDQDFSITIEPNPVKNNSELKVIVSGGPASKIILNIYDLAGRVLQSETFTNAGINKIQLKTMSAGTYLYKLIYEHKAIPGKIMITGN
ncbi:MAG: T9SS type A sorting domain-containing protein [Ferruginibacter sp.]